MRLVEVGALLRVDERGEMEEGRHERDLERRDGGRRGRRYGEEIRDNGVRLEAMARVWTVLFCILSYA